MSAGADDFLSKPIRKNELLARLGAGSRILRLESRLSQLAAHDALTELPTRRAFDVFLAKEWERAHRYRLPLSAVMLDIDFFKRINDTHGHLAGDEVIRQVAALLRGSVRECDFLCRYGGEEFVVLLPETDEAAAVAWAERFRSLIADHWLRAGDSSSRLTISLGVAEMLADVEDKEEFLSLADQCLLAAKEQGRNRVVSFRTLTESGDLAFQKSLSACGLQGITVRDAMIPLVHCASPEWTVARATAYFLRYRVASVPVTDSLGNLLGIISEKDVLGVAHTPQAPKRRVDEVMRSNVIAYDEGASLAQVINFLTRAPVRSVVVTCGGKPSGIISRSAVVRWFLENRWTARRTDNAGHRLEASDPPGIGEDATLFSLADRLVELAGELRSSLQSSDNDPAPVIGGASRMQQMLDDLLSGYCPTGSAARVLSL
jgi:diguanylate cyclase (GGDEF)-like protein